MVKLEDLIPVKVLLTDGEWYSCENFEWVDVVVEELEKEGNNVPAFTVTYAKFVCLGDTVWVEASNIVSFVT